MESQLISIIGLLIFATLIFFGIRYASGKWKVADHKKADYQQWTNTKGKKVKKSLIAISIVYGILILIQLLN